MYDDLVRDPLRDEAEKLDPTCVGSYWSKGYRWTVHNLNGETVARGPRGPVEHL